MTILSLETQQFAEAKGARRPYERPTIIKISKMDFPLQIMTASTDKPMVCKQCSSCHGCR